MATNIQIYQGDQIGGCVTVIEYSDGSKATRIMIDYGQSLPGSKTTEDFKYEWEKNPVDAVFFTHYHGDHIGRIKEIPPKTQIYMGAAARQVMINIYETLSGAKDENLSASAAEALSILQDSARISKVKADRPITIGPITVTGYSVDHSAYDAYMYVVETPEKNILHTGDFRGHGYRGKAVLPVIEKYVRKSGKRDIHILITEGTMMNRHSEHVPTEAELQKEAISYFKQHKYVFLICSSTNLDSLASFYQAASRYDMRMYTYSAYFCQQMKTFSEIAGKRCDLYQFEQVYPLCLEKELHNKYWEKPKKQKELMREHGFLAAIKPEDFCEKYIDEFLDLKPVIVYSMWDGYLDAGRKAYKEEWDSFLKRQEAKGIEVKHLHTSGHASAETLGQVIEAVEPREAIYPIHTENAAGFCELDIRQELKDKVLLPGKNQP